MGGLDWARAVRGALLSAAMLWPLVLDSPQPPPGTAFRSRACGEPLGRASGGRAGGKPSCRLCSGGGRRRAAGFGHILAQIICWAQNPTTPRKHAHPTHHLNTASCRRPPAGAVCPTPLPPPAPPRPPFKTLASTLPPLGPFPPLGSFPPLPPPARTNKHPDPRPQPPSRLPSRMSRAGQGGAHPGPLHAGEDRGQAQDRRVLQARGRRR